MQFALTTTLSAFPSPEGEGAEIAQYADDMSTIVTTDSSVLSLVEMFGRYLKASGAKLNLGKCHGLLLGHWCNRTSLPVDFRWSSGHIVATMVAITGGPVSQSWKPW